MFFPYFKKTVFGAALLCSVIIFWPSAVGAVSVSPLKQTVTADPGTEQIIRVRVENTESQQLTLVPSVDAFAVDPKTGAARFGVPDDAIDWFVVSPVSFTLEPRSEKEVLFAVRVPSRAEPGTHGIGLFVQTQAGGGQISASSRIGSLLFLVVSGTVSESLMLDYVGTQSPFVWRMPAIADVQLKNTGTVHVVPEGDVILLDMYDREIARRPVNVQRSTVLPGGVFTRSLAFDRLPWTAIGRVEGAGTVRYGASGQTVWVSFSFWYVPWQVPAVLVIGIGATVAGVFVAKQKYA